MYIDLNMVRAGAVDHPKDWVWSGYQEIQGKIALPQQGNRSQSPQRFI